MNADHVAGNMVHLSRCGEKRASRADMVCALPVVSEAHNADHSMDGKGRWHDRPPSMATGAESNMSGSI